MESSGMHKRSDLFLLRLWTDQTDEPEYGGEAQEVVIRHGRLLNVLNGEGHNFDGWPGLIDLLEGGIPTPGRQQSK